MSEKERERERERETDRQTDRYIDSRVCSRDSREREFPGIGAKFQFPFPGK